MSRSKIGKVFAPDQVEEPKVEEPKVNQHNDWCARLAGVAAELPGNDVHKASFQRIQQAVKSLAYTGRRVAAAERKTAKQAGSAEKRAESKEKKLARIDALRAQIAKLED